MCNARATTLRYSSWTVKKKTVYALDRKVRNDVKLSSGDQLSSYVAPPKSRGHHGLQMSDQFNLHPILYRNLRVVTSGDLSKFPASLDGSIYVFMVIT